MRSKEDADKLIQKVKEEFKRHQNTGVAIYGRPKSRQKEQQSK